MKASMYVFMIAIVDFLCENVVLTENSVAIYTSKRERNSGKTACFMMHIFSNSLKDDSED